MATASSKAKRKYNDKNYVRINLLVKPDVKEEWQAVAAEVGESLSQYIAGAVAQRIKNENTR